MCLLSTFSGQTATRPNESASGILEQFESTTVFWEQFEVAKKIVALHDKGVLPRLEPWLRCEDMRRRGNAAFVFARLGDDRGFQVIQAILEDRWSKRAVFEIDSAGHPSPARQIRADRYYAAHLFGDLKDLRAVPILVALLKDEDVKEAVPWSLGEIGDKSAIPALKEALGDNSLTMRASALLALEKLERDTPDYSRNQTSSQVLGFQMDDYSVYQLTHPNSKREPLLSNDSDRNFIGFHNGGVFFI